MPFGAEPEILAQDSADPVALTEAEAISEDELILQEAGRDLRPDTIVPAPDVTAAEVAAIENLAEELVGDQESASEGTTKRRDRRSTNICSRSFRRCCIKREH